MRRKSTFVSCQIEAAINCIFKHKGVVFLWHHQSYFDLLWSETEALLYFSLVEFQGRKLN